METGVPDLLHRKQKVHSTTDCTGDSTDRAVHVETVDPVGAPRSAWKQRSRQHSHTLPVGTAGGAMKPSEIDLFGAAIAPVRQPNLRPEAGALAEVLSALQALPCVAWAKRQNTGSLRVGKRFIRFGWVGCSDIVGQMTDGRFLACEVKSPSGKPTAEQSAFISQINSNGGIAFVARNCADVFRELRNE